MKLKQVITGLTLLATSQLSFATCVTSNEISTPPFNLNAQNSRIAIVTLSNVSDETITVSMKNYNNNGTQFANSAADFVYGLSGFPAQAPITLAAKSTGYVYMKGNGNHRIGFASIKWESSTCMPAAMTATIEHQVLTGDYPMSIMAVNGGKAF